MTTREMIDTEYMLYELEAIPKDVSETRKVIRVFIDDMDETVKTSNSAINENIRDEYVTKVKNFFLDLFGYESEDVEQFGRDTGIILRHSCLASRYKDYFTSMSDFTNDDNYVEMCKLAMFTYQSYTSNYQYLESLRDSIKFATQGITYYSGENDTQGEFSDFFERVFEMVKGKEKVYKR